MNELENWLPRPGGSEPVRKYHRIATEPVIRMTRVECSENDCTLAIDIESHTLGHMTTRQDVQHWVDGHPVCREDFRDVQALLRSPSSRFTRVMRTENGALK